MLLLRRTSTYLEKYGIQIKPGSIFNMDETGMLLHPKNLQVVVPIGMKNPSIITSGNKSQIVIVGCISAAGFSIPPVCCMG